MNWVVFFLTLILVPTIFGVVAGLAALVAYAPAWVTAVIAVIILASFMGLIAGDAGRYGGSL